MTPNAPMKQRDRKVTPDNREALKAAAVALRNVYPTWPAARIAATLGICSSTTRLLLREYDEAQANAASAEEWTALAQGCNQLKLEDIDKPSAAPGTARQTVNIINEREAIATLKIAAKKMELGARALGEAADKLDALIKAAFVKGTQAAETIEEE